MDLDEIKSNIVPSDIHVSEAKALVLEMSHNVCNGDAPSIDFVA